MVESLFERKPKERKKERQKERKKKKKKKKKNDLFTYREVLGEIVCYVVYVVVKSH